MNYKEIASIIIELKNADLCLRDKLIQRGELDKGYNEEMKALHNKNSRILDDIIGLIGYPTAEKVGLEASESAWLVIQHSIGKPDFMRKCAKLLNDIEPKDKKTKINLAYLSDRIATFEGKPQLYGTQFDWDQDGKLSPNVYDDLDKVNIRRKSLGLKSLHEQTEIIRTQAIKEKQSPPTDFNKRQEEIDEWKRSVGWIK